MLELELEIQINRLDQAYIRLGKAKKGSKEHKKAIAIVNIEYKKLIRIKEHINDNS